MEAVRLHQIIENDGELTVSNLPFKKGQHVEVIVLTELPQESVPSTFTAKQLRESDLIGLWQDRTDITDSAAYARSLRDTAQHRQR